MKVFRESRLQQIAARETGPLLYPYAAGSTVQDAAIMVSDKSL